LEFSVFSVHFSGKTNEPERKTKGREVCRGFVGDFYEIEGSLTQSPKGAETQRKSTSEYFSAVFASPRLCAKISFHLSSASERW
jgi:hypothetical protein